MEEIIMDLEVLADPSEPITFITDKGIDKTEVLEIVDKIKAVMENDKSIISLSAPQIGIKKRIFCIRFNEEIKTFINPIVTKKNGVYIGPETFLEMPGKEILIARPEEVTVVYYTGELKYEDNKLIGPAARIFDQMSQLLDGVLPTELGLVSDIEEDGSLADITDQEELNTLLDYYKQFIAVKTKTLEDSIRSDEAEAKLYDNLRFTESVINGRTQVIEDTPQPKLNYAQRRKRDQEQRRIERHQRKKEAAKNDKN